MRLRANPALCIPRNQERRGYIMTKRDSARKLRSIVACFTLVFALVVSLAAHRVSAQAVVNPKDIAATWQGTLHAGQDLRTVVKITKADGGGYKAVFYSIDQTGRPFPFDSITLDGSTVKMSLKLIGGSYEGKLSSDGNTIDGNWSQGPNPLPLVLTRTTPETEWTIPTPPPPTPPMAADADPSFEVATIKPNDSGATQMQGLVMRGREFLTRASSLQDLMSFAYSLQAKQIAGGPDWVSKDRYDIEAVPDASGLPNSQQIRIMIRKLLTDRFQLKFHHEQREMSAYVLTVAKGGEKLKPTQLPGNLPGLGMRPGNGDITLMARNATPADLTGFLQILVLDRPVVDRTGLPGRYDMDCTFTPDDSQFGGHPPMPPKSATASAADAAASAAPSLYDAFEQQLGLKLSAEKTAVDVIVIDSVQKPSAN